MEATILETCVILCLSCVCKSVTSVPTVQEGKYWLLQDRGNKEADGARGGVLRNGALSVWL